MSCPKCGASLDIDLENIIAYCPHCGAKLMFDAAQIQEFLIEKEKTKQKIAELEHEKEMKKIDNDSTFKMLKYFGIALLAAFILLFIIDLLN